jgi:cytochrome c-type biogenesis protein CcmH/NrfG
MLIRTIVTAVTLVVVAPIASATCFVGSRDFQQCEQQQNQYEAQSQQQEKQYQQQQQYQQIQRQLQQQPQQQYKPYSNGY